MENKISQKRLDKYFKITETALKIAGENIKKETQAKEIINMVENYVSDAKHFKEKGEIVNAFAALNYAHGWLDAGVRLDVFDVDNNKLFTIK